jgi:hypothetical protein
VKEKYIARLENSTWQNGDLLFQQLSLEKHRAMCRGVVMQGQPILPAPNLANSPCAKSQARRISF